MSLSQPKITGPCSKFIEFKADTGVFQFWNKEKKENVKLEYPIRFIVLDELNTIKGFSDSTGSGIYSNEVHSIKNQTLNVRSFKGGLSVVGKYDDIKAQISSMGGKFCKSVYAALINGDKLEMVNFQLSGAAFKSWIDKKFDVNKQAALVKDCSDAKKGKVEYKVPNWIGEIIPIGLLDEAVSMDKKLQEYLKARKLTEKQVEHKEEDQSHPAFENQQDEAVGLNDSDPF